MTQIIRTTIHRYFLAAVLFLLLVGTAQAEAETRNFSDWQVSCDIYEDCTASTSPTVGSVRGLPADYVLQIARGAYGTYWEISFIANLTQPMDSGEVAISVDQQTTILSAPDEFAAFGDLNSYYLYGDNVQAIMDQLAPGETISVNFTDVLGSSDSATFSLAGLTAALLWIDERQQRLGSERVAKAPPGYKTQVTNRDPDPLPPALLTRHAANTECGPFDQLANGADIWSFRLNATYTLHMLPCWSAAYNFGWLAYVQDGEEVRQQYFAYPPEEGGWAAEASLANVSYDEQTQTLSSFHKGRGLGDCGTQGLWKWNRYSFSLIEFNAKYQCDNEGFLGEFPLIYRAPSYQPGEGD